jgi:transposase
LIMARGYRRVDRDQQFLLPPDMREWLPADDPVWLVIEVVSEHLDTSAVHRLRRLGGAGRAGYDPVMLLTLLVWAWSQRMFSSRRIERACCRDVGFRVICAGDVPDHVTIARFRAEVGDVVQDVFAQVLVVCGRLGLGQVGLVAVDGTKLATSASTGANRTGGGLRKAAEREAEKEAARQARRAAREAAEAHTAADAAEDARFGDGLGDVMQPEPEPGSEAEAAAGAQGGTGGGEAAGSRRRGRSRSERIAEALADLAAEERAAAAEAAAREQKRRVRSEAKGGGPVDGRPPAAEQVGLAEEALARARQEATGRMRRWQDDGSRGRSPCPGGVEQQHRVRKAQARLDRARAAEARRAARAAANPQPESVRNMTDPQSRLQPIRGGGWIQGYNAQAVTSQDGIILATSVSNNPADAPTFLDMMAQAETAVQRLGGGKRIGLLLADAGYLSDTNLTAAGPDRLIAVGKRRDLEAAARQGPLEEPPPDTGAIMKMAARLRTEDGIKAYRQRGAIAETVFGHGKYNLGFTRFTGRGLDRAEADWAFHGIVHNIGKIIKTGNVKLATT